MIVTGSHQPERAKDSDASFNIGVAVGALSVLPSGVWVAMSGRVFRWDQVALHHSSGKFVSK